MTDPGGLPQAGDELRAAGSFRGRLRFASNGVDKLQHRVVRRIMPGQHVQHVGPGLQLPFCVVREEDPRLPDTLAAIAAVENGGVAGRLLRGGNRMSPMTVCNISVALPVCNGWN